MGLAILSVVWPVAADGVKDPTRPSLASTAQQSVEAMTEQPLILQSIILGQERRLALINGRRVAEGEAIEGVEIVAIENRSVSFQRDGEVFQLQLTGAGVSRVPRQ